MKKISTQGITYIEPLEGSGGWYWGIDHTGGDLYEAEELFRQGHPIQQTRLILLRYPDGKLLEPIKARAGQYFGRPVCCQNKIMLLRVDFGAEVIEILQFDTAGERMTSLVSLPLSSAEDYYNLMLKGSPPLLCRQGHENTFQILWPEAVRFTIGRNESFCGKVGEKLYFSAWYEDPDHREEVLVRRADDGTLIDRFPGSLLSMPDGQIWILT